MRGKNLVFLSVILFALLLLPSVKAYATNTNEIWEYSYYPDGEYNDTKAVNDCNKTYLIDNSILDINASWDMLICLRRVNAGIKYSVMVANYSNQYRGLMLNDSKLYLRDFNSIGHSYTSSTKAVTLVSTRSYTGNDYMNFVVIDHEVSDATCYLQAKGFIAMADMGDLISCPITSPLCGYLAGIWNNWFEYYILYSDRYAGGTCTSNQGFRFGTAYGSTTLFSDISGVDEYSSGFLYVATASKPTTWWITRVEQVSSSSTAPITYRSFWIKPTNCSIDDFKIFYTKIYTLENSSSIYWYYQQTGDEWRLNVNYQDPVSSVRYGASLPPVTPNATQIAYFQQGVQESRMYCSIDNTYYLVNHSASFSKILTYYPVNVIVNYWDENNGVLSPPDDDLTVTIECFSEGWEDGYTFGNGTNSYTLQTPCLNNNMITVNGNNYVPSYYQITNYNIPVDCDEETLDIEILKKYNVTFQVRDCVTGLPLPNTTVEMPSEGLIDYTDAYGYVVFSSINPYTSSYLKSLSGQGECVDKFVTEGTGKTFYTWITNDPNYVPSTLLILFGGWEDWRSDYAHIRSEIGECLFERSIRVTVHLKTSDGIEFYPRSGTMYAYDGNRGIKYYYQGKTYNQSVGYNFPATFIFYDNRTVYNVTFSLDYAGRIYNESYEVYGIQEYDVDFYIDKSSAELPCENIGDCPSSYCTFTFHNNLLGCINNICTYSVEDCDLCDDDVGCYNYLPDTPVPCTVNDDCYNLSYCDNNLTSIQGLCGSEGICLIKEVLCPDFCDQSTGLCNYFVACNQYRRPSYWTILTNWTVGLPAEHIYDQSYVCGLDNVETRVCVSGMNVSRIQYPNVKYEPKDWVTETIGEAGNQYTHFYDYIIYCDYECEIHIEYCKYGCSENGECLEAPESWESVAGSWLVAFGVLINTLFPTLIHRYIFSIIVIVAIGLGVGYLTKQAMTGGLSMLAVCLLFLAIGWLPAWLIFIFIVLGSFAIYKTFWGE